MYRSLIICLSGLLALFPVSGSGKAAGPQPVTYPVQHPSIPEQKFRALRENISSDFRRLLRGRFDFPIASPNNDIWRQVLPTGEWAALEAAGKPKPFTGKDFMRHFRQLFPGKFVFCLNRLPAEKLVAGNEELVVEHQFDDMLIARLSGRYFRTEQRLVLVWQKDPGSAAARYTFEINKKKKMVLKRFELLPVTG